MKKETLTKLSMRIYPSDFEHLKKLKENSGLPWPSFFKLIIRKMEGSDEVH